MLQAMIPKNESKLKAPILDIKHLKEYINAEWVVFKKNLRKTINPHLEDAKGNSFCQFIHDGVTLDNKSKYQAYAMQFTDSKFRCNHVIAMSFRRVKSSTAQVVSDLARAVTKELTDHDFNTLFAASVQDAAAKSVARHLNVEVETCDMHDGDKVGGSAIGELVRKNGRGGDKNPFKPGKDL